MNRKKSDSEGSSDRRDQAGEGGQPGEEGDARPGQAPSPSRLDVQRYKKKKTAKKA